MRRIKITNDNDDVQVICDINISDLTTVVLHNNQPQCKYDVNGKLKLIVPDFVVPAIYHHAILAMLWFYRELDVKPNKPMFQSLIEKQSHLR